jgi:glyoxylase-like metal-dependent hydrolase (beta-lactamase superfamily II)
MINIKGSTYYIPAPVCIGVYLKENKCIIIDTGIDESSGKKILKELKEANITPVAIINTHSHADHFGGNNIIQKKINLTVCSSEKESAAIQYPEYEPFYLFSSSPVKEMKNKFFMGKESKVDRLLKQGKQVIEDFEVEIIPLPGHSIEQIGILTKDNVLFCADSVLSKDIIHKYYLPYVYDVEKQYETLEYLRNTSFDAYVMSHGGLTEDIAPHVDTNITMMKENEDYFLKKMKKPLTREKLLAEFAEYKGIEMNMVQYPLLFASVSAYLSYLANAGKVKYDFEGGSLIWNTIDVKS